jgi:AraC-like DNA-binding protein
MLSTPNLLVDLLGQMHPIIQQRWPSLADNVIRDFAINLNDMPYWIRTTRRRMLDAPDAAYWYVELRPLERGELPTVSVVPDERIARAIAFMHEEYQASPSLSRIAQAVHISPFHFHRMFSKQVGVSPKHYLQGKQLQVAKWLLRSTRLPIGTIATRAGFASHGHFTSTFHRLVGMSPTEYREKS